MEIICIFEDQLFAFHYSNEMDNEYNRLMELWKDVDYLYQFATDNKIEDKEGFVKNILDNVEQIEDLLDEIVHNNESLGTYFRPLFDTEMGYKVLSLQKGKTPKNQLRLYAIRIDGNCFVITGGAIKMSQEMQAHPDTAKELKKLNTARNFLQKHDVFDEDSFYEFLNEDV